MTLVIDCVAIGDTMMQEIIEEVKTLKSKGITPGIATLLVGDDFGSRMYRGQVERFCEEVGFNYINENPPADIPEKDVIEVVKKLNADSAVSGILPLRPFPEHISDSAVINTIDVNKDIDCFHPFNMGKLALGEPTFPPATPAAVIEILERYAREVEKVDPKDFFEGAEIVVVGHSNIVGKPAAFLALNRNATTTVTHVFTSMKGNLAQHTTKADILIVAAGKADLIGPDLVKEGAIVIDVGINRVKVLDENGQPVLNEKGKPKTKTVGDVSFDAVKDKTKAITPVPGGVGSVTNRMLIKNALKACRIQNNLL
ncbi:MAG: bifunctional 5,10-methylene-tetrahydrofolate dehydrogenase/5,10-methylene-tetrahydrofolate cyclohydrolase [Firmicutes bacterium]|jgi:methylenetetrahydrofolate dehydrogenase (NADP+)/methenyltetrahydrofolate cyclohydrolase|nr:bifunctional 5,10-methylene-tetrahydrofolate dehydrogenase/5,10-methylene-tetrahydrofolate cyclohydrolase [Bacillota bacterium]